MYIDITREKIKLNVQFNDPFFLIFYLVKKNQMGLNSVFQFYDLNKFEYRSCTQIGWRMSEFQELIIQQHINEEFHVHFGIFCAGTHVVFTTLNFKDKHDPKSDFHVYQMKSWSGCS